MKNLLAGINHRFGRLDAAVNIAAGGGRAPAPLGDWGSADFDSAIGVNLRGVFLCMKYEIKLMLQTGTAATIVNMSSTAGEQGVAGLAGYAASKFGVAGLTRVARSIMPRRESGATRWPQAHIAAIHPAASEKAASLETSPVNCP